MCVGLRALVVACVLGMARAAVDKKYNITIGYLPTLWSIQQHDTQGLTISGAISIALEELNNSTEILPDVKILMRWNGTSSGTLDENDYEGLMKDMIHKGVVAFFGPEGRCFQEAHFANLRNIPMLSYKCADYETTSSALPNFVRMEPTGVQAMKSVISLLRYYRWNKFSILYEDLWLTAAQALNNHARNNNMTVNHQRLSYDGSKGWSDYWYQPIIQDTKTKTRIYVFLGSTVGLINMMSAMDSQNLFVKGEYMVLFVDMKSYMPKYSLKYLTESIDYHYLCPNFTEQLKRRARSLLVVTSTELSSHFQQFADQVRRYNKEEPFQFPEYFETHLSGVKKFVSIYAAYLYDSVKLYATALDELIKEDTQKEKLTNEKLMNVTTDGSRIVARILKKSPFKSVSGLSVQLDENANSVGNFAVLAFKSISMFSDDSGISCSHTMIPVGHFQQQDKEFPEYKLNPRLPIDWADGVKPEDEPSCGFSNCNVLWLSLSLSTFIIYVNNILFDNIYI